MNELLQLGEAERSPRRRLSALAFLDVVDYSRLMAIDEEATLEAWSNLRQTVVEPEIVSWRGRVVDRAGDGIFAEFGSALEMLGWAISVQEVAKTWQSASEPLQFRIALHLTDVFDGPDGTVSGDGVNITARLHRAADAGGIVVSQTIFDAVYGKIDADFVDLGNLHLKNLPNPVHAFRVGSLPNTDRPNALWRRPLHMAAGAAMLLALMLVPALTKSSGARGTAEQLLREGIAIRCPSFPCGPEILRRRALFTQAIESDPSLAQPYAEAAITYAQFVSGRLSTNPQEDLRVAANLATQAIVLAPNQAFSHNARGEVLRQDPSKLEEALTAFQRALAIDPTLVTTRANAGYMLLLLGRTEESEDYVQAALKASPQSPSVAWWLNRMGLAELFLDREGHGADYFRRAIELQSPVDALSDAGLERGINLASALALNGDIAAGHQVIEQLRHQYPAMSTNNLFAWACSHAPRFLVGMQKLKMGAALAGVLEEN